MIIVSYRAPRVLRVQAPPNFTLKLMRPGFGPAASCLRHRKRGGVTAVAVRDSVLRTSCAATAAPLRLWHAGPAAQLSVRSVSPAPPRVCDSYCVELPTSVAALLIAIFAVLPGVPGEKAYRSLVGVDWREDKWQRTLRLLTFSIIGLALYVAVAQVLHGPAPAYVTPSVLQSLNASQIGGVAVAFLGHVVASAAVGVLAAFSSRMLARLVSRTAYSSAWDHFVNACVKLHWVTIGLSNGEVYLGYIDVADMSVAATERDIILREPARYDVATGQYRAMEYQSMFLPGPLVCSVAVISDVSIDKRLTVVGEILFQVKGGQYGKQE
jgi:hypothetical protein